jgi:hypothetical protein
MRTFFMVLSIIMLLFVTTIRIVDYVVYDINCGDYLKRAADANTIEIAKTQLDIAISYMKENKLTNGYTSILYKGPSEDIGFWYTNIISSREELNKVEDKTTQLEKTNILMKLRETLLDNSQGGQCVTEPQGISVYPHNMLFAISFLFSTILTLLGMVGWIARD